MIQFFSSFAKKGSTFKSIAGKLRVSFASTSVLLGLIIAFFYWFHAQDSQLEVLHAQLARIGLKVEQAHALEQRFLLEESINEGFYRSGQSPIKSEYRTLTAEIQAEIWNLKQQAGLQDAAVSDSIQHISDNIDQLNHVFDSLVFTLLQRGFKDYGVEGDMRMAMQRVTESGYAIDLVEVLSIRRREKDYILRKDTAYVAQLQGHVRALEGKIRRQVPDPRGQALVLGALQEYERQFLQLVALERKLGMAGGRGLRIQLEALSHRIEGQVQALSRLVAQQAEAGRDRLELGMLLLAAAFVLLNFLLSLITTRSLSQPIEDLSNTIQTITLEHCEGDIAVPHSERRDEIGKLSRYFQQMVSRVQERTKELMAQQLQTAEALYSVSHLGELGQQLAATRQIDEILQISFGSLRQLMDASVIWVGLHRPEQQALEYFGHADWASEERHFFQPLANKDFQLGAWCFANQREVHIQHYDEQQEEFGHFKPVTGERMQSVVYIPLTSGDSRIGVLGVQQDRPHAFREVDLDILRGFASYLVVALDNALVYEGLEQKIQERTAEVQAQKADLEQYAQSVSASINYAKRIQEALLPNMDKVRAALPDSFVFLRPRDVVSGDFFWFHQRGAKIFVAALDCTGHGVPGAFMSMIGNELLNEAVIRVGLDQPDEILFHVHKGIRRDLRQYETDNRDGIDMSICVIDQEGHTLTFAGARSPLVYMQNGDLQAIKPNAYPVGGEQRETRRTFTPHTIPLSSDTVCYLFSDGFQDQFGGADGRKFMKTRFRQLLHEIHHKPMSEQRQVLEGVLRRWMGQQHRQIDDVLVVGFRLRGAAESAS
jgi:serine phosphatase RsbU (regulator of sigma subunit)/HAMP domain-containing protein